MQSHKQEALGARDWLAQPAAASGHMEVAGQGGARKFSGFLRLSRGPPLCPLPHSPLELSQ